MFRLPLLPNIPIVNTANIDLRRNDLVASKCQILRDLFPDK